MHSVRVLKQSGRSSSALLRERRMTYQRMSVRLNRLASFELTSCSNRFSNLTAPRCVFSFSFRSPPPKTLHRSGLKLDSSTCLVPAPALSQFFRRVFGDSVSLPSAWGDDTLSSSPARERTPIRAEDNTHAAFVRCDQPRGKDGASLTSVGPSCVSTTGCAAFRPALAPSPRAVLSNSFSTSSSSALFSPLKHKGPLPKTVVRLDHLLCNCPDQFARIATRFDVAFRSILDQPTYHTVSATLDSPVKGRGPISPSRGVVRGRVQRSRTSTSLVVFVRIVWPVLEVEKTFPSMHQISAASSLSAH